MTNRISVYIARRHYHIAALQCENDKNDCHLPYSAPENPSVMGINEGELGITPSPNRIQPQLR
jgi:hypothetical protein